MKQASSSAEVIRFGVFEADIVTGELRKHGLRIKLQDQPFQVLCLLLAHPGELVTREELRQKLWPAETFVDFEQGLNKAINKLREALSDDRETPRYIETLPRRGYRFIAPVLSAQPPTEPNGAPAVLAPQPDPVVTGNPRRAGWITPATIVLLGVLALLASGYWYRLAHYRPVEPASSTLAATPIRSLAVLPLQNLSGGHDQEYFADGMTDELITDLGQMSALRVISRTSTVLYKETTKTLPQIGRELGTDAILEGAVFRSGNRVRITAQLIDARTDQHLWAHAYERDLRDVLEMQDEVARDIANEISVELTPGEQARLATSRSVNPDAYDAYVKGRGSLQALGEDGITTAIKYFERAIELDTTYAAPYTGLADAYSARGFTYYLPPREAYPRAKAAAAKALALDENSAEAYSSLCWISVHFDWDWQAAEKDCTRALELDPNSGDAAANASDYYFLTGRANEALTLLKRSVERDPLAADARGQLGWGYFVSRRYDEAIAAYRQALALDPTNSFAWEFLGHIYVEEKMYREAYSAYGRSGALKNAPDLPDLGYAYGRAGERDKALEALEELKQLSKRQHVPPGAFAFIYTGLGDKDQAFQWLEKALEERDSAWFPMIKISPVADPLRSDPRFQALLRRMNFPA